MVRLIMGLIFFLFVSARFQTESYTVNFISAEGDVLHVIKGKPGPKVKLKEVIHLNDQLFFKNSKAKLVVMNSRRGSLDVTARGVGKIKGNGVIAELANFLNPPEKPRSFETRTVSFQGYDPEDYFDAPENDGKVLLVPGKPFVVIPKYHLDQHHFFFVQYKLNDSTYTEPITHIGQSLIFEKNLFRFSSDKLLLLDYALCYQASQNGRTESQVIAHFKPVLAELGSFDAHISVIDSVFVSRSANELDNITMDFFNRNYGKAGLDYIRAKPNKQ